MKFIATIFLVYLASKVLRPTIEELQRRIKEGMAAGKVKPTSSDVFKGIIALFAFVVAWRLLDTTVLTFFMFWVGWQLFKPLMEELQQRAEKTMADQRARVERDAALRGQEQTASRSATAPPPEPKSWEPGQPLPGDGESDLERLFDEAMERKRRLETTEAARPQSREHPAPAQPRAAPPRTRPQRVPQRVEPARVARPRGPARPARRPSEPRRAAPRRRESVEARRRAVRKQPALAGLCELDKNDIRRGIIMAEILGSPKALRDIDSHII